MPHESLNSVLYTTAASAQGGRGGRVRSEDGVVDLELGKPGSVSNPKANPETLFAAGWASCFNNALGRIATVAGLRRRRRRDRRLGEPGHDRDPRGSRRRHRGRAHLDDPGVDAEHRAGPGRGGPRGVPLLQGHARATST